MIDLFVPLSPPFRAILSFSRRAHWLSCCAHGGFLGRLGVEEWERWTTWVGLRCGGGDKRLASAISGHGRGIIGDVLGRPMRFFGRQSA